jgi:TrmH family RNA methyltransferase
MTLTRRETSLLRALTTRGGRRRSEHCRCEGVRAVRELLARKPELLEFVAATARGIAALGEEPPSLRLLDETEFSQISDTVNSQGVLALARVPENCSAAPEGNFILVLDQIGDPGNFGTMARTLLAVGGRELWITKGTVDPWCDKAIRSGLGAQFALNVRRFDDLDAAAAFAADHGFLKIFYADPHRGENCFVCPDLYEKSLIIIGGEANGSSALPTGTRSVRIPMPGDYESLNAAQAATVLLVEHARRVSTSKGVI